MCKRSCLLVSLILAGALVGNVRAASVTWGGGGGADKSWATPANWSSGACPTLSDDAKIMMNSGETDGPLVSTNSPSPTAATVRVGGASGGTTYGTLRITTGGTLNIGTSAYIGWDSSSVRSGELYMDGGSLKLGVTTPSSGNLYIAHSYTGTKGILKIFAGDINVPGSFIIANSTGTTGNVYLNGGMINAHIFTMGPGTAKMDISTGMLIIDGNVVPTIRALADANTISAYNGLGTIVAEYDTVYAGKTTVTATLGLPEASNPFPADGATNISLNPTLTWAAGAGNPTHDVYLGTSFADVNSTSDPCVLPGRGNQVGRTYNPPTLAAGTTYYWRIDEVNGPAKVKGAVWSFTTLIPSANLTKGPYLIYPGDNTKMTVLWQLASTQSCTLAWGLDPNYSTGSTVTTEYGSDHQHKYTIAGLTPGTKYYYRVTTATGWADGTFRAAPASGATSVKFLAYGDTRTFPADHSTVCAGMNSVIAGDPDFQTMLLHVGDWVEADAETNWTNEFFNRSYAAQLQTEATLPIQGCVGNHEYNGGSATYYAKYWPYPYVSAHYWSFDYGPAHVAVLDLYGANYSDPNGAQLTWLANDLSTSTKPWKFIVLHNPGWSSSPSGSGGHTNDTDVQAHIQPLCEQYGVQIVFAGHNHYYSRAVVNGVHHITTGGGGAPLYTPVSGQPNIVITAQTFDFCKISIDGNSLTFQAVQPNGTAIDTFYVDKDEPDFTFVQATDPQMEMCPTSPALWEQTVSKVNKVNPAFLVVTGDLVNAKGNMAQVNEYKTYAAGLNPSILLYNLPGNHDIGDTPTASDYAFWRTNFGYPPDNNNPWYSFTYGNNLFICLDSMVLKSPTGFTDPNKAAEEMNWLTTTLQGASGYDNIIVFMHISLCLVSTTEGDQTFNMPLGTAGNGPRKQLLDLFHQYGVKAVFSGHYHVNAYVRDGDLEIITTNSCTCPLGNQDVNTTGFRVVDVYPNHIIQTYRTLTSFACPLGDFNCDGIVDFKDVGILTEHWLENGIWP